MDFLGNETASTENPVEQSAQGHRSTGASSALIIPDKLDIYSYLDYRAFCRDFYHFKKQADAKFSFRSFAREADVAGSYLKHVMDGIRNLSPEMSLKFAHGMGLETREAEYFEALVRFNQASNLEEKSHYLDRLRRKRARALKPLGMAEAVNLLSHWYVVAIKELVVSLNTDDPKIIQKLLRKKVPEPIIEKALQDLKSFNWILLKEGQWTSQRSQIQFPDEVRSYVVRSFHRQMLALATDALDDDLSEREFGSAVFTFPLSELPALKAKIKDMQMELVSFVQDLGKETNAQEQLAVYQFGMQCFSLQKPQSSQSVSEEVQDD